MEQLSKQTINKIIHQELLVDDLTNVELASFCEYANQTYRQGEPIISDKDYDFVFIHALKERYPEHQLLQSIEPEGSGFSTEKFLLPQAMLSIDKAYSWNEIEKWLERIKKSTDFLNISYNNIKIKATPKLDGFAAFDDGKHLYTRGDGKKGSDISRVFTRGLQVFNSSNRGQGAGEIVIKKSYFTKYLTGSFEYPRNFQASLIKEKELDEKAKLAISKKAALFVPFAQLPSWENNIKRLIDDFDDIVTKVLQMVDFDVDGVVFEVLDKDVRSNMGANRKFHRWQIAFKENKDKAKVSVISVTPQVGRSGKITPVAELNPTFLSGAKIKRATGHHYGLVKQQGLGAGSIIELTRSGLVIPKINKVLKKGQVNIPKYCPSCNQDLVWDSDFLICPNHHKCPAQIIGKMEYFFKILANNDGFGIKTIEKLYSHNITKISQIYALKHSNFTKMGFGDKTGTNLVAQLKRSRVEQIEDWRFLAAFGISRMGIGNCENLLKSYPLADIFNLNVDDIAGIDGFAKLSANEIVSGLKTIYNEFDLLFKYNFNLENTKLQKDNQELEHKLFAKKIVFTGKMNYSRDKMKKNAKAIGAIVATSVSSKTDFLVIGKKVGQKKIENANKSGIKIITESEYLDMIGLKS